ncbi:MAG TPA: 5-formyltetrahydrofolate cyclo-ligase [Halanaerobiales bacterium]|nr:5-formyltetrahydrofolate cyclo-ligase [Halanaerobiales bacterium]
MDNKREIREYYLNIREAFPENKVREASKYITDYFFSLKNINNAEKIMLYYSFKKEIRTWDMMQILLKQRKEVYFPITKPDKGKIKIGRIINPERDFVTGVFDIKEPGRETLIQPFELDIIVVPGIVFSKKGYRIGYGGGYYDRFLVGLPDNILTVGLTYSQLLVDKLPVRIYDKPVGIVLTERGIYYPGRD